MNLVTRIARDVERLETGVRAALQKADLLGLVRGGAPKDEYDGEARQIVEKIGTGRHGTCFRGDVNKPIVNESVIEDVVYAVFASSFGRDTIDKISRSRWSKVAKVIADIGVR